MKDEDRKIIYLIIRYFFIILLGFNLIIFYKILTPLTITTLSFILNIFYETITIGNSILFDKVIIEIIPACVAGAAYYLLFILVFSTPNIKIKKRIVITILAFSVLFALNILRINILALINQSIYFEPIHLLFWYFLSTIFVAGIWIFIVFIFKIKHIPVYSDLKFLYELINPIKKTKRKK